MTRLFNIGMGKVAHASTLSAHCRNEIIDMVNARATAIGLKRSAYVNLILEKWMADGCPPVSTPDRLMRIVQEPTEKAKPSKR